MRKMNDFEIRVEKKDGEIFTIIKGDLSELITAFVMIGKDLYDSLSEHYSKERARAIIEKASSAIFMTSQELEDEVVKKTFEKIYEEDE